MFESINKFIPKAAAHFGIAKEVQAAQICEQFRKMIPEKFPQQEAPQSIRAAHYRDNQLTVHTENSAWAQEVIMRKDKLIDEMNTRLGKKLIKDLKTLVKNHPQNPPDNFS